MEDGQPGPLYSKSPNDSQFSRISIGALLNPSQNNFESSSISAASPLPHVSYHSYHQQNQHYSGLPYHHSHHHSHQNLTNAQSIEGLMGGFLDQRQPSYSGSATSSPGLYPRERFPSVSSGLSTVVERRRPPRPKYDEEEMYFIWYHRVDLRQEWKEVRKNFNAQFPDRQRKGFQGIQCKYYRFIKEKNVPTLREQRRKRSGGIGGIGSENASSGSDGNSKGDFKEDLPQYGVIKWTEARFTWMRGYSGNSDTKS
ncbi:uncharacterized protein PADG_05384 [Paracoccidioides brasiliensis Pb18]|uniref:Uncharacterized protein n=1 Tax=Paracoccidioides brasiliensis (strain Pb18) TaxID=502780 RepID=C1GDP8_PARBD|nr:uncharacterized protein PADG_05384 [Paracoccidioides brasiliensis Pb18]EEH49305.1 hypothetical protein PADG_05384 [Paracoccidioides brasiliensis Pb18]